MRAPLPLLLALVALPGCATPEDAPPVSTAEGSTAKPPEPASAPPASEDPERADLPISLVGSTGTQAFVCAPLPPYCAYHGVVPGESEPR